MENNTTYSRIIAGTMTWGSWGKQHPKKEMIALMHHCTELNITTFDHADIYGGYTTEAQFGNAFEDSGISRESIQLITKCGIQMDAEARKNKIKHYNYTKDYIVWSAEQSIKNLRADYLDFFLLHRPSPLLQIDEVAEAIALLQEQGKIKDFGVSNFTPSQIAQLDTAVGVRGNQVEFSLTANEVMYDGTLDDMIQNKRLAMSWSPLGSYFKEENDQTRRIKSIMPDLLKKYNVTEDQLLLAWVLRHPATVRPVVGTATPQRLSAAQESLQIDLELEDWFALLAASEGHEVP